MILTSAIRTYANTIALKKGEVDLKNMLDYGAEELLNSGKVAEIIAAHPDVAPYITPVRVRYGR